MSVVPWFTEEELERLKAYGMASAEEKSEMMAVYEHCYLHVEDR